MTVQEKIYWHDTVTMPNGNSLEVLPSKVDFAVIGAGFPGLAAAYQMAKRGIDVAVLEAETPGWGASSRNGGMALTGLKLDASIVEKKYGAELTKQLFEDSLASVTTVETIITQEHIECDFARTGSLLLANKPAHYRAMQSEAEWYLQKFNHRSRLVSQKELSSEIGSGVYFGGLVDETSAGLNPAQYVAGLARASEYAGAMLISKARVIKIDKTSEGFKLHTSRGEIFTQQVLVATGGYTGRSVPNLQKRIIPIGSYIIATQALPESLAQELIPNKRMVFDYKHYLNYYRLSADHRMVFGGRAAFFPETSSTIRNSARILQGEMVRVFPQLAGYQVEYVWGGTLDFAFDQMPHAGVLDGIYYALGFAGHGVALGTHLGIRLANAIIDGTVKELPYNNYVFPIAPLGLYNGKPWFLPLIGLWHKILDWVY